jgi:restriction endonuclease Mrr
MLKRHKGVMSLEQLSEARGVTPQGASRATLFELKRALNEANEQALTQGERPPFTFELTGEVGLSEWGVSSSMRAAEGRARRELEMYREQLYVGLSERLRELPSSALSALLSALLEALGYERVELLNASQEGVALMAHHSAWGETLVLMQRTRKPLGAEKVNEVARSLSALMADRALLISLSGFHAEAEGAQRKVQLLNERALIDLMIQREVGVSSYALKVPFMDEALFARLTPTGESTC